MTYLVGSHHVTLSVGHAQEDVDFHTRVLGMRFIKKTVLYDGSAPIYHFYYSNANGDPSSVVTTFPWAQAGVYGKRGTNQAREVLLSVPAGSLDYWAKRLGEHDILAKQFEAFGSRRLEFEHPSGIEYVFVGNEDDPRVGFTGNGVPRSPRSTASTASASTCTTRTGWSIRRRGSSRARDRRGPPRALPGRQESYGNLVELTGNRYDDQGTWKFGAGTYHHFAWNLDTLQNQEQVKFEIEGAGYTDISELKDRTTSSRTTSARRAAPCSSSPSPRRRRLGLRRISRGARHGVHAAAAVREGSGRIMPRLEPGHDGLE